MVALEERKAAAVAAEDFLQAKVLKEQIETLAAQAAKKPAPRRKKGEASVKRARSAYNFFVAE